MCFLSITYKRFQVIDYTVPVLPDEMQWMTRAPSKIPPWIMLLNALDFYSWMGVLVTLIAIIIVLLITVRVGKAFGVHQVKIKKCLNVRQKLGTSKVFQVV